MIKNNQLRSIGCSVAVIFLALSLVIIPSARAKTIKLKASTIFPMKHRLVTDGFNLYDKEIQKRTKGQVNITWYHASTLVKAGQAYDALKSGVVDMALVPVAALPHYFPVSTGVGLPFMSQGPRHSVIMGRELLKQVPEAQKEWSDVKLLFLCSSDVNNLAMREKEVKTLADLKGLRIGVAWGTTLKVLKCLPCSGVLLGAEDMYMSLQRKMADGVMIPNAAIRTWKITDLTSYHTIGNFDVMPTAWVMSKRAYEKKLTPEMRHIFDTLNASFARLFGLTSFNEGQWVMEALKQRGDVFHYLSPEEITKGKGMMKPLYDAWIAALDKKGYDGQAMFDKLQAISDQTRKAPYGQIDEWWKQGGMGRK